MFRLSVVEFVCIVAIGVAMVELSSGHRYFRGPETLTASAPAGAEAVASRNGGASQPADERR